VAGDTITGAKARRKKPKRWKKPAIALLVIVLAVGGYLAYRGLSGSKTAAITYTTQAAQKVTIIQSVSGTGNVNLNSTESVNPEVSGTVSGLAVALGDKVTKSQVLFTVVNEDLDTAVTQATNSYKQALNSLEGAELSLEKAQKNLDDLEKAYSKESWGLIDEGQGSVRLVSLNVTPPSTTTTTTVRSTGTTAAPSTTSSTISDLDVKIAEQQVTSAQLSVTVAQTNVTLAQMSVDDAKNNVAKREVTAPLAGTVTGLNISEGDTVSASSSSSSAASAQGSSSSAALVITDLSTWDVTVTLTETDISSVKVGQKATLTFDALPDVSLTGKVTSMDVTGTNSSGVVSYSATVTPDTGNDAVLGGMTVTASIITLVAADVIGVPLAAVKTASDGTYYVQLLENGKPVNQTVEIGSSDDTYTEITSGLTVGQEVITKTVNPSASTSTSTRSNGGGILNQGGGGFPTGGGPAGGF
jgi:RND family efflux transporter MFP subunit